MTWRSFWGKVGHGISHAFGVITSPIKWAGGIIKDTIHSVVHLPQQIVSGVKSIAGDVTHTVAGLGHDAKDLGLGLGKDLSTVMTSPMFMLAAGGAALLFLKSK